MTPFRPTHRLKRDYYSPGGNYTVKAGAEVQVGRRIAGEVICFGRWGDVLSVDPDHLEPIAPGGGEGEG